MTDINDARAEFLFGALKICHRETALAVTKMLAEIAQKIAIGAFDEDVDFAVAAKASPHVERNHLRFAGFDHGARQQRHFFL